MSPSLNTKAKLGIFFGITILVGGAGVLIYDIIATETIEDAIKLKNFSLLDDDKQCAEVLKDYTEQVKIQKDLKIRDFEGGIDKIEEFKKQCKWIIKIKYRVAEAQDFVDAALWCVKQQTVEDYLIKNKHSLLKAKNRILKSDNPKWDKRIKEYLDTTQENKFPNLIIKESTKENIAEAERTAFIKECENLNKIKHFSQDFEKSYELAVLWCTEESVT